jgi:hypothetical protein
VKQTEKPFPFEYWWREVKDEPKWLNRDVAAVIRNKRNKMSASEAYTSSNQETERHVTLTVVDHKGRRKK